jgi:hypothetical protein
MKCGRQLATKKGEEGGRVSGLNHEDRGYIEKLSDARTVNQPNKQSLAEVDGNRTRQTRIARLSRFEGGGAHQVPGHLHLST